MSSENLWRSGSVFRRVSEIPSTWIGDFSLAMENGEYFRTYRIDYHGGEKYPHLEVISGKPDVLAEIVRMKAAPVPAPGKY